MHCIYTKYSFVNENFLFFTCDTVFLITLLRCFGYEKVVCNLHRVIGDEHCNTKLLIVKVLNKLYIYLWNYNKNIIYYGINTVLRTCFHCLN